MTIGKATTPETNRRVPALRLEHLWVLVILGGVAIFISLSRTLPNDFWWHLKAGELIATTGLPTTNIFAWTLPADTPYVYQSWLGEWLFYILYQLVGFPWSSLRGMCWVRWPLGWWRWRRTGAVALGAWRRWRCC
ncbi:MAG: hypothetical protein HC837_06950 [Chloroflexaceae bacterium]|nr:hypothetical protein [Chloroflexaceae bacterium]